MSTHSPRIAMLHVRHPLSALFGDMAEPALLALADDIEAKGILEPVVLYEGQVLDGWHRCKAGQIAGVEIPYTEYPGDDPGGFVLSKNLHRRQQPLTAQQRAQITVQCRDGKWRRRESAPGADVPTDADLAAEAETSVRAVQRAKRVEQAGLGESVAKGEMSAKAAEQRAREANGAPPPPPKKTEADKLKERIADLEAELAEEREKKEALADELQAQIDAGQEPSEQEIKFQQLYIQIRTLKSQVREWTDKFNLVLRENKGLRERLGIKA